jgi:hypothetical protein
MRTFSGQGRDLSLRCHSACFSRMSFTLCTEVFRFELFPGIHKPVPVRNLREVLSPNRAGFKEG